MGVVCPTTLNSDTVQASMLYAIVASAPYGHIDVRAANFSRFIVVLLLH